MTKSKSTYYALSYIFCFLFILCSVQAQAQQKDASEVYDVDSTLYAYYLRCKAAIGDPEVMQMTDTLFRLAGEKQDMRMQAVALCTKLDYYYYEDAHEDSLLHYIDAVKKFAKETHQPKYYYFVWAKRLILYYIKNQQYNTALYEADKMTKQAEQDNYPAGMADGFNAVSTIYQTKKLYELASESREKEIEIIQKYKINTYNLSNTYGTLAFLYCKCNKLDKAAECLEKAKEHIYSNTHEYYFNLKCVSYYINSEEYPKAKEYLQKAKQLLDTQKEVAKVPHEYYSKLRDYYVNTKQYLKALATQEHIDSMRLSPDIDLDELPIKATIYKNLGNPAKALEYYQQYIHTSDSLNKLQEDIAASEYATRLGVERLNTEKLELQQEMQQRDLASKQRIIFFLIALLALGFIIFYREHLLNGRLRASQKLLSEKNHALRVSREELIQAKEQAEQASIMKTEFIQNMSHEIRTPLNSIVGFSQILGAMSKEHECAEAHEFADIIEQGSNNLLHLVDDVLDLASLDSGAVIPTDIGADATAICRECIVQIEQNLKPGIDLKLQTEADEFYFYTNPVRLSMILSHLLKNAAKFTNEGSITLDWHRDEAGQHIIFSVTDTGIGIPKEKQEFVFDRFTKVDTFTQGTGLGLSIGRICAEKMGGNLTLDPNYTNGCRFILTLPLSQ